MFLFQVVLRILLHAVCADGVVHSIANGTAVCDINLYKPTQYHYDRHISSFHDQNQHSIDVVKQKKKKTFATQTTDAFLNGPYLQCVTLAHYFHLGVVT